MNQVQKKQSTIEVQLTEVGRRSVRSPAAEVQPQFVDGAAKRVGMTTLGCKVNTYETELIGQALKTRDWQVVDGRDKADLYLINTCTVTREADRQARQAVRRAIKVNPEATVIVTGCYAQMDPEACAAIPGVDLVLGNDRKLDVHDLLPQLEAGELPTVMVGDLDEHLSLPKALLTGYEAQTRAFVQIQQGCDQGCTFCIIHVARGRSRSFAPSLIKRQVQRLVMNGYPEIVICGVDLGAYGEDFDVASTKFDLVDLLEMLLALEYKAENPFRIRLSSIDPHHITDRLIALFNRERRLCPHIHLSLQSGNTLILKRMKRRYDAAHVRERINAFRSRVPELVLSADVMVGFPTETDEQFMDTVEMVRELDIVYPHVFSYSERDGTPAARIPAQKQVPVDLRKQRNKVLREAAQPLLERCLKSRLGRTLWVLPEQQTTDDGRVLCRAEDYSPTLVPGESVRVGEWVRVIVTGVREGKLLAEID